MQSPVGALAACIAIVRSVAPFARPELPAGMLSTRSTGTAALATASAVTVVAAAVTAVIAAAGLAGTTPQEPQHRTLTL